MAVGLRFEGFRAQVLGIGVHDLWFQKSGYPFC